MTSGKKASEMTPEEIIAEIKSINKRIVQPNAGGCCGPAEQPEPSSSDGSCCGSDEEGDKKDE